MQCKHLMWLSSHCGWRAGTTAPEERVVLEAAELGAAEDEAQRVSEIHVADSEFGAIDDGMNGATYRDNTKHAEEDTVALLQHQPRMHEVLNRWAEVDDKPEFEVSAVVLPTKKKISKVVLEEVRQPFLYAKYICF